MVNMREQDEKTVCRCAYCELAMPLPTTNEGENDMLCEKYGVVRADHSCRRFRYDLLKRTPKEKVAPNGYHGVSSEE